MIKLERTFTPAFLTPEFVKDKTDEFKNSELNVWNIKELKEALLKLSNGKCAYCECALNEESKYMEVEHFEDKKHNPDLVLEWENLLPSCKRCNGAKSTHDVKSNPIINPFTINPTDNLIFRLFMLKGKTPIGNETVDVINLNHPERAVLKRFEIGHALEELIDEAIERLDLFLESKTTRRRNRLLTIVEGILKECQPSSIYSATCTTILHSNENYQRIEKSLKELDLWTEELDQLNNNSKENIFEIR